MGCDHWCLGPGAQPQQMAFLPPSPLPGSIYPGLPAGMGNSSPWAPWRLLAVWGGSGLRKGEAGTKLR